MPQCLIYRVETIVTTTILSISSLLLDSSVFAQIVPDGTLNTQVNLIDGQQKITGGTESGNNLFHSFEKFSPNLDVIHFDNSNNIQNIFTRVTGGSASLIDVLIKANGSASLFIINPAGIIFGNNAQLDIGGSFITTTAESIIFDDGTKFGIQNNQTSPLLTISIPSGLQYGNSPGDISSNNTNRINLKVSPGNTIAFLGGNIKLQNIAIESGTTTDSDGGDISLFATNYIDLNNILLSSQVEGFDENNEPLQHPVTGTGGNIIIEAKDIKIRDRSVLTASTLSQGNGGSIKIKAKESIELSGIDKDSASLIVTGSVNGGTGGEIKITTGKLLITSHAVIDSSSPIGQGNPGNITIEAHESITVSKSNFSEEFNSRISASSGIEGFPSELQNSVTSGNVTITTPQLFLQDGGKISVSNFGMGNAGDITVNAEKLFLNDDSEIISTRASGNEGSININSSEIILRDNASIATTAEGNGNGGNITIKANNIVMFDDSNINANANEGDGGNITITTQSLLTQKNPEDVITASSERGIDGIVTINTPDNNSKLETSQARIAPLAGEESIYTGCSLGTDFSANKFSYIGRGGIRKGPFDLTDAPELVADLGIDESEFEAAEFNANQNLNYNRKEKSQDSITEMTTWIINDRGNIELIAQAVNDPLPSGCLFN